MVRTVLCSMARLVSQMSELQKHDFDTAPLPRVGQVREPLKRRAPVSTVPEELKQGVGFRLSCCSFIT